MLQVVGGKKEKKETNFLSQDAIRDHLVIKGRIIANVGIS
jgi:hypothetical protein